MLLSPFNIFHQEVLIFTAGQFEGWGEAKQLDVPDQHHGPGVPGALGRQHLHRGLHVYDGVSEEGVYAGQRQAARRPRLRGHAGVEDGGERGQQVRAVLRRVRGHDRADDGGLRGLHLQRAGGGRGLQQRLLQEGECSGLDPPQFVENR